MSPLSKHLVNTEGVILKGHPQKAIGIDYYLNRNIFKLTFEYSKEFLPHNVARVIGSDPSSYNIRVGGIRGPNHFLYVIPLK
jgi:hypothetical protein